MKDELSLKDLKINIAKLLEIGFLKEKEHYTYKRKIRNNQFLLNITIDDNNIVDSSVIELSNNEEYMIYNVISSTGELVGKMREEYSHIIEKVKNTCCSKSIFKSEYANLIIEYIKQKYNDELEYLWEKFPNNAIWRNKNNNKWYGALLIVEKSKIGIVEEGTIEIIDLLLEPEKIEKIVDNKKYFAGYHMNKKHWITIKLDGSIGIDQIYNFIDNSYELSIKKR